MLIPPCEYGRHIPVRSNSKEDSTWVVVPLSEERNLSVVIAGNGDVVATVQNPYAAKFQAVSELAAASEEVFQCLRTQVGIWSPDSSLGKLQKALALFNKTT